MLGDGQIAGKASEEKVKDCKPWGLYQCEMYTAEISVSKLIFHRTTVQKNKEIRL